MYPSEETNYLEIPIYKSGELIRITRDHFFWDENKQNRNANRVGENSIMMFIEAYNISNEQIHKNWKRSEWNLKVLHPIHGIIWVASEYTGSI